MIWPLQYIPSLSDAAPQTGPLSLHWHQPTLLLIGLILLIPLFWFIANHHRSAFAHLPRRALHVLTFCRASVLLLLILILGGPYARMESHRPSVPVLIVLIDESASMSLVDPLDPPPGDADSKSSATPTRLERLEAAIKQHHDSLFAPLSERYEIHAYRFAQSLRRVDLTADINPLEPSATQATALGDALHDAVAQAGRKPLAGIVLFTDGQSTAGREPLAVATSSLAARALPPMVIVPVGSKTPMADLAILDVLYPRTVARGDVATIVASVTASALPQRTAVVSLLDGDRELDRKTVTLRSDEPQRVSLTFADSTLPGPRRLRIHVEPWKEEVVHANNDRQIHLRVDDQRLRMLYLESAPRWDFRFLDHALQRDRGIDLTVVMESQLLASGVAAIDLPVAAGLPADAAAFAKYDLIMLGDISPQLLPLRWQEHLTTAVLDHGVGLIIQAGTESMPHRFAGGPLSRLMPVNIRSIVASREGDEAPAIGGIEAQPFAPFHMQVTAAGAMHPTFMLYDQAARNRQVWSSMPPFHWAAAASEAKPGATVLAQIKGEHNTHPLIAEQNAGRGRVLFVGTDSTYLWRRQVGDAYFQQFWGQAIRHVAKLPSPQVDSSGIPVTSNSTPATASPPVDTTGDELANLSVDRIGLATLAEQTRGQLLELDQIHTLNSILTHQKTIEHELYEDDLWDNWLVLMLLSTLYCVDVGTRRWSGLL